MRQLRCLVSLLAVLTLAAPFRAAATNGTASYAGGAFATGTAVGKLITVVAAPLTNSSGVLSLSCPITAYTAGTYALNWTCAGGTVTITSTDNSIAFKGVLISGSMSFTGSGGGRGGNVSASYQLSGSFSGTVTAGGVTQFAYGSLVQVVDTSGQIGSSTAPVSSGSLGWNSGFSPLLVGDAINSRVVGADNIAGANLFAFGSAGSGVYEFGTVAGLAQDAKLRIYATDSTLDRVVRVDAQSSPGWTTLGSAGAGASQFNQPQGVSVDAAGKIWVADTGNHRIVRFDDMAGTNWAAIGSPGAGVGSFSSPASIAFDTQGRVYVADTGNNRLVRFDDMTGKNWSTLTQVSVGATSYPLTGPASIATNAAGKVYVALASGYLVRVDDISGANASLSYWGGALTALSIDKAGTVYVAGNFTPGIAQALDADATGYFAPALGSTTLQASALLALSTSQPPPAEAVLSPAFIDFGSQSVGVPTPAQTLTLLNLGASPLGLEGVSGPLDYPGTSQCSATLAPGASCTSTVLFQPTTSGSRNGSINLTTSGARSLIQVFVNGTGTAP